MEHLKCHIYDIPGIQNIRDIGGYQAKNGKTVRKGRFIRSAALSGVTKPGEDALLALGVECVIDLRSNAERKIAPDTLEHHRNVHYAHIPMLDYISSNLASGDFTSFPKSMAEMYIGLLEHAGESFRRIFGLFSDERFNGYVFHCTAGKDRTGVTAMLLLGLAGVADEMIVEDYAYTEALTEPVGEDYLPDLPRYLFGANPETMRAAIAHIRGAYVDISSYLLHIGVTKEQQRLVLEKLLT